MGERYRSVTSVSWYTFTSRNTSLITYSYEGNRQMLHRKQNAHDYETPRVLSERRRFGGFGLAAGFLWERVTDTRACLDSRRFLSRRTVKNLPGKTKNAVRKRDSRSRRPRAPQPVSSPAKSALGLFEARVGARGTATRSARGTTRQTRAVESRGGAARKRKRELLGRDLRVGGRRE
jgi:hypothetical protein